jgi:tetratricopeptide (TPR) repeat protein
VLTSDSEVIAGSIIPSLRVRKSSLFRTPQFFCASPKQRISRYRSSMQPSDLYESTFQLDISPAANRVGRLCSRPLILALTLFASALVGMAAQTGPSRAAEIHDRLRKAAEYLKARNPNSAVKEFDAVLALDPKNAEAYANLGVIAFFQRDYQNASQYLRKALAIDPSLAKTQALLGICQKRLGDPAARVSLEKSFANLKDKPLRLQVGMELAALYDQQGDSGATAAVMRLLVNLDPDNVDVLFMAQRVYSELADSTLNKLAVLAPGSARMQQVIAQRLVNGGDLKGAIEHYRKALQIDPRLPGVHFELAEGILESSRSDAGAQAEAERELEVAVTTDGDTSKTECEFARIAWLQSQMEQAFAHYQRAYELNPNEVQAQLGIAKVLMKQQKPQEALKYLRMAVRSDPLNSEAHYRLAQAYQRVQMADKAQQELNLLEEIKKTTNQVEGLYRQMNIQHKPQADEISDDEQ